MKAMKNKILMIITMLVMLVQVGLIYVSTLIS